MGEALSSSPRVAAYLSGRSPAAGTPPTPRRRGGTGRDGAAGVGGWKAQRMEMWRLATVQLWTLRELVRSRLTGGVRESVVVGRRAKRGGSAAFHVDNTHTRALVQQFGVVVVDVASVEGQTRPAPRSSSTRRLQQTGVEQVAPRRTRARASPAGNRGAVAARAAVLAEAVPRARGDKGKGKKLRRHLRPRPPSRALHRRGVARRGRWSGPSPPPPPPSARQRPVPRPPPRVRVSRAKGPRRHYQAHPRHRGEAHLPRVVAPQPLAAVSFASPAPPGGTPTGSERATQTLVSSHKNATRYATSSHRHRASRRRLFISHPSRARPDRRVPRAPRPESASRLASRSRARASTVSWIASAPPPPPPGLAIVISTASSRASSPEARAHGDVFAFFACAFPATEGLRFAPRPVGRISSASSPESSTTSSSRRLRLRKRRNRNRPARDPPRCERVARVPRAFASTPPPSPPPPRVWVERLGVPPGGFAHRHDVVVVARSRRRRRSSPRRRIRLRRPAPRAPSSLVHVHPRVRSPRCVHHHP